MKEKNSFVWLGTSGMKLQIVKDAKINAIIFSNIVSSIVIYASIARLTEVRSHKVPLFDSLAIIFDN